MSGNASPIHLAVLCGSLRGENSYTLKALRIAAEEAAACGATVDVIDLAALGLPFREGVDDTPVHPGTGDLKKRSTS